MYKAIIHRIFDKGKAMRLRNTGGKGSWLRLARKNAVLKPSEGRGSLGLFDDRERD